MHTSHKQFTLMSSAPHHRAPAIPEVHHLLDAYGGAVRAGMVAKRLGVAPQIVDHLRQAGRLLGLPMQQGVMYPVFQFDGRGMLSGFSGVLTALGDSNPWECLQFLLSPHADLGGRCPVDALRAGELELVQRMAQNAMAKHALHA